MILPRDHVDAFLAAILATLLDEAHGGDTCKAHVEMQRGALEFQRRSEWGVPLHNKRCVGRLDGFDASEVHINGQPLLCTWMDVDPQGGVEA